MPRECRLIPIFWIVGKYVRPQEREIRSWQLGLNQTGYVHLRLYLYPYPTAGNEEEEGKAIPHCFVQVTLADWGLKGLSKVASSIFPYFCQGKVIRCSLWFKKHSSVGSKSTAGSLIATC